MDGRLRVGFDGLFLEQPMTGSGRYALSLWKQLRKRLPDGDLLALVPSDAPASVRLEAQDDLVCSTIPRLRGRVRKVWWEQIGLPRAVWHGKPDVVHVPYFAGPAFKSVPYVVTIHDLIPMAIPAYRGSPAMRAYLQLVAWTAKGAAIILTDSEHSRHDIERYLDIPSCRIRVVPLAADQQFSPAATDSDHAKIAEVRQRYGLERPFVLNTGGLDARKQVPLVIEGFARALSGLSRDHDLVIVGRPHSANPRMYPALEPIIRRHGLNERVRLVGAVEEDAFVALYRAAELFVFASAYEGFGLTPLEAMACGAPVVSSCRSSLPEVVGDAGVLVEPSARTIAAAIVALVNDDARRSDYAAKGIERSKAFSWSRTAKMTLAAYRDALQPGGGGG